MIAIRTGDKEPCRSNGVFALRTTQADDPHIAPDRLNLISYRLANHLLTPMLANRTLLTKQPSAQSCPSARLFYLRCAIENDYRNSFEVNETS
jgi:hypothetical protein